MFFRVEKMAEYFRGLKSVEFKIKCNFVLNTQKMIYQNYLEYLE